MNSKTAVSTVVTALVVLAIVLSGALGVISYQYALNYPSYSRQVQTTTTTTFETTQTVVSTTTVTTQESVSGYYTKQPLPANFPKTCLTTFPSGFDLNRSTYFIITNFTTNFAQICVKYTYYPQNDTSLTRNGTFDANFSGSMFITNSFGNASQGGTYPYDAVYAFPQHTVFNSSGETVTIVYDFQWSFIFSYFFPAYARCGSPLFGIGIAQTNGNGSSGVNASCPAFTYSNLLVAQLVGTSYLKPAVG